MARKGDRTAAGDGFVQIPNWLIEHSPLSAQELLVYIVLLKYRNHRTGVCHPGFSTIADEARLSRRTVMRVIEQLESLGLISVSRQPNKRNEYSVALPSKSWPGHSVKGTRIPRRANPDASDSESPVSAATRAGGDSESPGSDSESPLLVTRSHPNKTKITRPMNQTERSPSVEHVREGFSFVDVVTASEKQLTYLWDLSIMVNGRMPSEDLMAKWARLPIGDAAERIRDYLREIHRHGGYDGPVHGDPVYEELSDIGKEWADRGMVPEHE